MAWQTAVSQVCSYNCIKEEEVACCLVWRLRKVSTTARDTSLTNSFRIVLRSSSGWSCYEAQSEHWPCLWLLLKWLNERRGEMFFTCTTRLSKWLMTSAQKGFRMCTFGLVSRWLENSWLGQTDWDGRRPVSQQVRLQTFMLARTAPASNVYVTRLTTFMLRSKLRE